MPIRLKNIAISFISLVKAGANRRKLLVKTSDQNTTVEFTTKIKKIDKDRRRFYSIVYPANEEDTQGEYATAEDIEQAAYGFMKGLRALNVDKEHSFIAEEAFVAESWLIRKDDSLFPDEPEGSWAVGIIVEDDELWDQVLKGEIEAISMGGVADRVETSKAADYDQTRISVNLWELISPLETAIRGILEDDDVEDKGGAIEESIEQFKTEIKNAIKATDNGTIVERLKNVFDVILNKYNKKGGKSDMKKEEIQTMIDEAIEKAMKDVPKPLTKENMTVIVTEAVKPTVERVEKLEKISKGSKQGDDDVSTDEDLTAVGKEIAKSINGE